MDHERPLFVTFRPEDNAASAQPGPGAAPRAEQPPEQPPDAQGRVGRGAVKGPAPQLPTPALSATRRYRVPHPKSPAGTVQHRAATRPQSHPTPPTAGDWDWGAGSQPPTTPGGAAEHPQAPSAPHPPSPSPFLLPPRCCRGGPQPGGARSRSWWPCGRAPGCGSSRRRRGGWEPRASSQPGSTASSAAGTRSCCCGTGRRAASWCASARAPWASSCPTGARERCRHFVLDQLPDGRYVILGERSAHAELGALLRHHATAPIAPYRELLTVPCPRQEKPPGGVQPPSSTSPSPATPAYSTVAKGPPGARQVATDGTDGGSGEAPSTPPPLPAKVGSSSAPQGLLIRAGSGGAAPEGPSSQREAVPPEPPEAKYQQLVRFHTYAEPRERTEPEEPIPFYAMGRGCEPPPEENVYSEVAPAQRELPPLLPRGARGPLSTLPPPKARAPTKPAHRRLFRSFSSQASRRRQPPAAPSVGGGLRGAPSPPLEVRVPPLVPPPRCWEPSSRCGGAVPGSLAKAKAPSQGGFPSPSHPQDPKEPLHGV
uniref:SH2 domain-containing protein 2A n=1 Tax=Anas platyrhynchos TaxID=8839 RepID=A0A8B9ZIY2_ANAPL